VNSGSFLSAFGESSASLGALVPKKAACMVALRRVAALFHGMQSSHIDAPNLQRHLLEPLEAEAILSLTFRTSGDGCTTVETCQLKQRLAALTIARLTVRPMPSTRDLLRTLEGLPHWNAILRAFNNTLHWKKYHFKGGRPRYVQCWHDAGWREGDERMINERTRMYRTPIACEGLNEWGNTIFAPVIGPSSLNTLWQIHGWARALRELEAHELARGAPYERVVASRLELVWLAPHPPLHLLGSNCAWVPGGEDYGGVNDRHALLARAHATHYLDRWGLITSGAIMNVHPALRAGRASAMTGERALAAVLRHFQVPVCRFASIAALRCCFEPNMSTSDRFQRRCRQPTCLKLTGTRFETSPGQRQAARGKYVNELRSAVAHGLALRLPDAHWAVRRQPSAIGAQGQPSPARTKLSARASTRATKLRAAEMERVESHLLLPERGDTLRIAAPNTSARGFKIALARVHFSEKVKTAALSGGFIEIGGRVLTYS
jgi:hypothetical protein